MKQNNLSKNRKTNTVSTIQQLMCITILLFQFNTKNVAFLAIRKIPPATFTIAIKN